MSNYPDDIRQYDNNPNSPFYEEGPTCEECGKELEYECDGDGGFDEAPHVCEVEEDE